MTDDALCVARALPLTADRFNDLDALFAEKGCSFARDCWCMGYRVIGKVKTSKGRAPANPRAYRKRRLKALALRTPSPGLIAYDGDDRPVGWVAVGPRKSFARLQNSPTMKPTSDLNAWVIVCFVVPAPYRGRGIAKALIRHAVVHARKYGAKRIEAFPYDRAAKTPSQWLWHGTVGMFRDAGFEEVARRRPERPIMVYDLGGA